MTLINNQIAAGSLVPDHTIGNPVVGNLGNPYNAQGIFLGLIPGLVGLALVAGTIIFFFMLVMGAIQWISSGGDKGGLEAARGKITNAIIGIVILFSLFAILNLIETFFGIKILTLDIGPLVIQ